MNSDDLNFINEFFFGFNGKYIAFSLCLLFYFSMMQLRVIVKQPKNTVRQDHQVCIIFH
jgi:hypothetical protein